jgi:hydroxyethylthiazole kinase
MPGQTAPPTDTNTVTPQACANALRSLRETGPLVQCLTNIVVANWTANVLLAVGAAPAMVDNPHEADRFARASSAVLVNLGTPYDDTAAAMRAAVEGATAEGTPWVIDPVGAGGLPWRTDLARDILAAGPPSSIRGNASEILGLTGRGVDSADSPEGAASAAKLLALQHDCVVAISGPVDLITDGRQIVRVANGHEWLTRVTGVGCSLGALMAAFSAVSEGCLVAATAATATLCVAAEDAAAVSAGPGSFAVALMDALYALTPEKLAERVRLS